jgi:hypothetical protein
MRWVVPILGTKNAFRSLILKHVKERGDLGYLDIDVRTLLNWTLNVFFYMDWINLMQDKAQWRAVVNTVMNIRAP